MSDVLEVLRVVAVQSKSSDLEESSSNNFTMTSDAAKEVLAQEKESNQVIKVYADIPAYSEDMDVTSFSSISY